VTKRLLAWLFTRPVWPLSPGQIVLWWEARRVAYNAALGVVGLLLGALLYGILANVGYTGGWIVELLVARLWSVDTERFGPIAFTLGMAFSVLVTLLPPGLVVLVALITSCGA
jgi:hypothetical protein